MEAPGEPGELMEVTTAAAAGGARGEQILEALAKSSEPATCANVERFRPARPFEQLRMASDRWRASHGRRPRILLLPVEQGGAAARRTPDAAFVRRLFAVGGVESIEGEAFDRSRAEAVTLLADSAPDAEVAESLVPVLKQLGATTVFLGYRPDEHEAALRDAGIDGFVYDGCDVQALLALLHERLRAEASS